MKNLIQSLFGGKPGIIIISGKTQSGKTSSLKQHYALDGKIYEIGDVPSRDKSGERGFNLVEVCLGILILAVITIVAVNLMRSSTATFELNETNRGAIEVADEMLAKLSTQVADMEDGGTFAVDDQRPGETDPTALVSSFRLTEKCVVKWCDYVLTVGDVISPSDDDEKGGVILGGGGWGPSGGDDGGGGGIIRNPRNDPQASGLGGFYPKPKGAEYRFFRRWSVRTIDTTLKLKVITVAIMQDEQATEPLLVEQTIVGFTK